MAKIIYNKHKESEYTNIVYFNNKHRIKTIYSNKDFVKIV